MGETENWAKSSLSNSRFNCVEVAAQPGGGALVRHSKDPDGPVLRFTGGEWQAFLGGVKLGDFDEITG